MVLDELVEIVTKYRNSSDIFIGGDVNASIHRSKLNSRDIDFQKFLMELNLKIPAMCPVRSTFYHSNNGDESQTDYFVGSVRVVEKCITFQREPLNMLSHDPIMVGINRKLCKNLNHGGKVHTHRIKWNKVDLDEYEKLVEMEMKVKLKQVETLTVSRFNSFVGSICDTLVSTAKKLQPKGKSNAKKAYVHVDSRNVKFG